MFFPGAVIGVSLALMGMMVIFTRKQMITKILGYLTMENGVLLFSLFVAELPFIIELLIILDLVMLIVLATVLAFGIDTSIDEFHDKLNSFTLWFKE
jgi:hydrogenase-4 component E